MKSEPSQAQLTRWRRYLANEHAEAEVYRILAQRSKDPVDKEILLKIAEAESRHQQYWRDKLGDRLGMPRKADLHTRFLAFMAKTFGSVFTLALMQSAESRSPYIADEDASTQLAMDEQVHAEVVRGLASRSRERMSGMFRAAVFGANDGLVSNLALVLGVMGSGVGSSIVLMTGVSGLLAGALSMAAGEYVSVKSQTELLGASQPETSSSAMAAHVDVDANELALVFRARGMSEEEAEREAETLFTQMSRGVNQAEETETSQHAGVGNAWTAAFSSFFCFAGGAFLPIIPFMLGVSTTVGALIAIVIVAIALLATGGLTGILSGKPPLWRAMRQLAIGLGAAWITYLLGLGFGQFI